MDKKGFSTLLLILLGFVFFLITGIIVFQIQTENEQIIDSTRSQTGESRLNFIAQAIQTDFYNTFLQGEFENIVATFLEGEEHIIDPYKTFKQNMGGKLEQYLSDAANSLVREGAAAQLYADAYSAIPTISCTPRESRGGSAQVWVRESENGVLELTGMTLGQKIFCMDTDEDSSLEILLTARNYWLSTRAIKMHNMAVKAIKSAKLQLDGEEGVAQILSGWKLANDADVRSQLLHGPEGWIQKVSLISALTAMEEDGIVLEPLSVSISNGRGEPFTANDIEKFVCYGDVKRGAEGISEPAQTCRPDDIELVLGEEPPQGESNLVSLNFKPDMSKTKFRITVEEAGVKLELEIPGLVELLGKLLEEALTESSSSGYARYSGVTHLCNAFRGKPSSVTISGSILETKKEFIPPGMGDNIIRMRFRSTPQSLDTSQITNDVDCDDGTHTDVIKQNVIDMLTDDGKRQFRFRVEKGPDGKTAIKQEDIDELQRLINANPMVATTGENRVINLHGRVTIKGETVHLTPSSESPRLGGGSAGSEGGAGIESSVLGGEEQTTPAGPVGEPISELNKIMRRAEEAAGELSRAGSLKGAEAFGRTATAVCKLMGLRHWMDMGDIGKALMAMCGIGNIFGDVETKTLCDLAALYQAVNSGSMRTVLAMLSGILSKQGFDFVVTGDMIQAALQTGDVENVLMAVSTAARLSGDIETADYLAQLAQIIHGVKSGNVLGLVANLLSRLGDNELAGLWSALDGIWRGVQNGDLTAALGSMLNLARRLGYEGILAQVINQVQGQFNMILDWSNALDVCRGKIPWDLVCMEPSIGSAVCKPETRPCIGGGIGKFSHAMPSLELPKLCNDMFFSLGFQIDCVCVYVCTPATGPPHNEWYPRTVRVDLNMVMMLLDEELYKRAIGAHLGDLLGYCKMDP